MSKKENYELTLKKFKEKYNINVSIDAMWTAANSLANLEDLTSGQDENSLMIQYANLLSELLKIYLDKNVQIKEASDSGLPDFSLGEFIVDFEEVMKEKYKADLPVGTAPTRKAYEGAILSGLFQFAGDVVKQYGKSVPAVWSDGVLRGVMTVEKLRTVTDTEYQKLMAIGGAIEQKVKGELDAETMKRLANLVSARDAMKQVRKSRGFLWVLGNLRINYRERKYYNQLKKDCDTLKKFHFPVDKVSRELQAGKFLPESSYDAKNLEKQTKPWLYGIAERFKKLSALTGYAQLMQFQICDKLPESKLLQVKQINELIECSNETNTYFDQDIKEQVDPEQAILSSMKILFKKAYQITASMGYDKLSDRLLATQIITDFVLRELTPASLNGNPFSEYANAYALNNPEEMITEIQTDIEEEGYDKETVLDAFEDANLEWVPSCNKFHISIDPQALGAMDKTSPFVEPQPNNNLFRAK